MNLRLEDLGQKLRFLRRSLGRTETHALIYDAMINGPKRRAARLEKIRYFVENMKEEKEMFMKRLDMGIFIAKKI